MGLGVERGTAEELGIGWLLDVLALLVVRQQATPAPARVSDLPPGIDLRSFCTQICHT
jgi:hypothetical protein